MQPTAGDRVRITRTRPDGTIRFTKEATIRDVDQHGYSITEQDTGWHRFLASSEAVARDMPGWTQTIKEV